MYLNTFVKLSIIISIILFDNIKINGCLCGFRKEGKTCRNCDISIDLPKDDSKYKKIIDFIKDPKNVKKEYEETDHEFLTYKPLNIDLDIEITEKEIKDIIDEEIEDIKNRTINVKNKEKNNDDDKEKDDDDEKKVKPFIPKNMDEDKIGNKLGNLRFIYIINEGEIIPVKAGTFFFDDFYQTKNNYSDFYKKTFIDYWYDEYFKKEVYNFEKLKEFWNDKKPDYLYCGEYQYPIFLFEKNENNKLLFENEKKNKCCSGLF